MTAIRTDCQETLMRRNTIGLTLATLAAAGVVGVTGAAIATAADDSTETPSSSATSDPNSGTGSDTAQGEAPEGRPGRPGRPGGHAHTDVTGDEAQKVIDAVTAEHSSVTVEKVLQDEDGSYDVVGTEDGARIAYEVSADLATVTKRAGGPGGGSGGPGCDGDGPAGANGGTGGGADSESGTGTSSDPSAANSAASV